MSWQGRHFLKAFYFSVYFSRYACLISPSSNIGIFSVILCQFFRFYIDLSWLFSTCIGLVLFLIEIGVIFFVKFDAVNYITAAYVTTALLGKFYGTTWHFLSKLLRRFINNKVFAVPVVIVFTVFSCLIHKSRFIHSMNRVDSKVNDLQKFLNDNEAASSQLAKASQFQTRLVNAGLQGVTVIDASK